MKQINIAALIFLCSFKVTGQENELPKLKMTLGYFGETFTHPGINAGFEYYPFQSDSYQMILASNLGGYVHTRNNTSLFIRGQWGQRVRFNNGFFVDQFIGLGYLHHFTHGGDNYEVLPNGAVIEISNSGRPMIMPSVAVGTGYDFAKKTSLNLVYFLRPELFWKAPFNGYYLTHVAVNTGFIFKFSKGRSKQNGF